MISMGRLGVDLYAQQIGTPLKNVSSFSKYLGGSPSNTAVGASRLGLKTALISRVGADPMGEFLLNFLRQENVDTAGVKTDPGHPCGLVFLGISPPEKFELLFYRENCADINIAPEDIEENFIRRSRALLVSGTGFSREPSRSATLKALGLARKNAILTALDLDFRRNLWPPPHDESYAGIIQNKVLPLVDLIVGTEEEFKTAAQSSSNEDAVSKIKALTPAALVIKHGSRGATAYTEPNAPALPVPPFPVEVLNVLGAGDAFMAGLLYGRLSDWNWGKSLELANACGAILVTKHGCAPDMPTLEEAQEFIQKQKETPVGR